MKVFIGADHRGFKLKEEIKKNLKIGGYEVEDMGAMVYEDNDDYVDYVNKVCESMRDDDRGILICGSGHGVDIAANKHKGIRSILGFNLDVVAQGREHEDANVLSLAADWIEVDEALEMGRTFLMTESSSNERHRRRRDKISKLEK